MADLPARASATPFNTMASSAFRVTSATGQRRQAESFHLLPSQLAYMLQTIEPSLGPSLHFLSTSALGCPLASTTSLNSTTAPTVGTSMRTALPLKLNTDKCHVAKPIQVHNGLHVIYMCTSAHGSIAWLSLNANLPRRRVQLILVKKNVSISNLLCIRASQPTEASAKELHNTLEPFVFHELGAIGLRKARHQEATPHQSNLETIFAAFMKPLWQRAKSIFFPLHRVDLLSTATAGMRMMSSHC